LTAEEVDKIKRGHEDLAVEEVRNVLPDIYVEEIRRLLKEHGDGNKVLEFLTAPGIANDFQVESQPTIDLEVEPANPIPNGVHDNELDGLSPDILATSMETLTIHPDDVKNKNPPPHESPPPSSPPASNSAPAVPHTKPKHLSKSMARKQKQAKRTQKDAAKRRKQAQAMGIEKREDIKSEEHVLKAIVI
jgi:hypothetical protein